MAEVGSSHCMTLRVSPVCVFCKECHNPGLKTLQAPSEGGCGSDDTEAAIILERVRLDVLR